MPFDPTKFLDPARALAQPDGAESEYRTAAGRAYYAVYGYLRGRICTARGVAPHVLFGRRGRHGEIQRYLPFARAFKAVAPHYNLLLVLRAKSDYDYIPTVTESQAASAVRTAELAFSLLTPVADKDYGAFYLPP